MALGAQWLHYCVVQTDLNADTWAGLPRKLHHLPGIDALAATATATSNTARDGRGGGGRGSNSSDLGLCDHQLLEGGSELSLELDVSLASSCPAIDAPAWGGAAKKGCGSAVIVPNT
jgi:hypothetical protein